MNDVFNQARSQENSKNKTGVHMTKCFGQAYFNNKVAQWLREEEEERARKAAEERRRLEEQRKAEEQRKSRK